MNHVRCRFASVCAVFVPILTLACGMPAIAEGPAAPRKQDRLVIHEWGTFTCLQDELGNSIPGVNTDDESVPEFVHRIADLIPRTSELAPVYSKGVPRSHRQVRMRLETPVVYFHPPAGLTQPLHASLTVDFRGGWLTEYYPAASVIAPGLKDGNFRFAGLTPQTRGSLDWHDLTIGGDYPLPETDAQVWLAPREVDAATVKAPGGEAEKYLFYRGVGNLPSPITVSRPSGSDELIIREDMPADLGLRAPLAIRALWLVNVRDDGQVAYRSLGAAGLTGARGRELMRTAAVFRDGSGTPARDQSGGHGQTSRPETAAKAFSGGNLARLRAEMRKELIADGLFEDEADAMLKTWELAYFKSPGVRLLYLLPQQWTDAVLPMKCSLAAEVSRTMVGRIELVTPRQRALIKKIGSSAVAKTNWLFEQSHSGNGRNEMFAKLWEGKIRFDELKLAVPPEYQSYLDLGRFRNALILNEVTVHPQSGLQRFVEEYHLGYYTPDDGPTVSSAAGNE
ncbi:MAG: hypothetical protein HY290_03390 [Planctomycetia bacterium]|nr:hypothetical protein [Planctomycetia bacterium]